MKLINKNIYTASVFVIAFVMLVQSADAQIINRSVQYMFNRQLYNPAAHGTEEGAFNASLLWRAQWTGVEGSPRNISAWADHRFTEKRMSVGVNFSSYSYAISRLTDFAVNYSYILPVTGKMKLSMGLRAGIAGNKVNTADLTRVWQEGDPYVSSMSQSFVTPKIGAGFQLYTSKFYGGLAVPDFFTGNTGFAGSDGTTSSGSKLRNYVAYAGGILNLSDNYRLLPSAIFYANPQFKKRIDGSLLFEVKDYFWAGVTVSSQKIYAFNAGTHISARMRLSYSYEFSNPGKAGSLSAHELSLRFVMDKLLKK